MDDRDIIRLKHMLDSWEAILSFVKGKKREHLDTDRLLISGIIREFEILGEAAGAVSQQIKKKFPDVPWKQLNGMRNRLIHAYFDVDIDIIWQTICYALPPLVDKLKVITEDLQNKSGWGDFFEELLVGVEAEGRNGSCFYKLCKGAAGLVAVGAIGVFAFCGSCRNFRKVADDIFNF